MPHLITVLPHKQNLEASTGDNLLELLRRANFLIDAPCNGNGTCGKCKVLIGGKEVLACQTVIDREMTVTLSGETNPVMLSAGIETKISTDSGLCLAIDIGTTTVVAYLIENGFVLSSESRSNPQATYGADVVSRVHHAVNGHSVELTTVIRHCIEDMANTLLTQTGKGCLNTICIVGNPAMQQLFLGMPVENLTRVPFCPQLTKARIDDAGKYIPAWKGAKLLIVPNISGYIGADTVACILATGMDKAEKLTLLVDIGTNGEMVLGNKDRLVACATAAGPALEGAGIRFGMRAASGAIDRVAADFSCHVIGDKNAVGICGSGLLDAVAVALDKGLINERGRILNNSHTLPLADAIFLTQEDIRQLQQAKGAICAGIHLMAEDLGISLTDIETVYLAGAFGASLNPCSACRIGMIPGELEDKIQPIGNAAGSGAKQIVCSKEEFSHTDLIVSATEHLNLATLPHWAKRFAQSMRFDDTLHYWCKKAISIGFSYAVPLDPGKLVARKDIRAMCAADRCGAYGKNHTCPPYCGSLEECSAKMHSYHRGILLQTVGTTTKAIDTKAYRMAEQQHLEHFHRFSDEVRKYHPNPLCLGSGGCRICEKCTFPYPCRFPEKACSSMEAYGLFVTDVCRNSGLAYHHGERTITYTACVLF